MRTLFATMFVAVIAMAPFAGDHTESTAWSTISSLVAPALVPILPVVALFDSIMSRVIMSADERAERYGTIFWTHVGLVIGLVLAWGPFFGKLL